MTAPTPHENHIKKAFDAGYADGIDGRYEPPLWMLNNPQSSLWIVAYQNGNRKGKAVMSMHSGGGYDDKAQGN